MTQLTDKQVLKFRDDPLAYFNSSVTQMHSIDQEALQDLQLKAMQSRFAEHRYNIEIVKKLADRLGIDEVNTFEDIAPLFFAHTAFKSYPASLLDKKRFDKMTEWLNKNTAHDLSQCDMSGCDSIDEWIERLDAQTPLEVITSSGTTGTLSIIPKDKHGSQYNMKIWRCYLFQEFGSEPTEADLNPDVHVVWPNHASGKLGHLRMAEMVKREFTGGDPSKFHALYNSAIDTDLLFLASKMRAAASRGELDKLVIDPKLAERKDEFVEMQARRPQEMAEFFEHISKELRGERIFMTGAYNVMYEVAAAGLESGVKGVFAKDSAILTGGGTKGFTLPDNYMDVILEFMGVDKIQEGYGMSEISAFHWACEHGHYHIMPWVIPFVLDPDTSEPLPRQGVVTGRAAFYDFTNNSHWGGIISGDEVTIDWNANCACGRKSAFFHHDIMRYSEKQGVDDDRISCSATQTVHDEAANFLAGIE